MDQWAADAFGKGAARLDAYAPLLESFATKQADRTSYRRAAATCLCLAAATAVVLPFATRPYGTIPGFFALNQGALCLVQALTTWLFFSQYRHTRTTSLLVLAAGALFTTLMLGVQLACTPDVLAPGLLLGRGAPTLTWLWTFWHFGPPLFALLYALLEGAPRRRCTPSARVPAMVMATVSAVAVGSMAVAAIAIAGVDYLPLTVEPGGGYRALTTSGIGPALFLLTVVALAVLWRRTRLHTVLQLWLGVSLVLLLLDNLVTDLAAARATIGWLAGRLEALLAGVVILAAYMRELGQLYRQAEATAIEREAARAAAQSAHANLEIALDASEMGEWELDLLTGRSRRTLRHDRIFGYATAQPAWGWAQFMEHVVPEDRPSVGVAIEAAMRGERLEQEFRIRRRDNSVRWVALWGRTTFDPAGRPALISGCLLDTTRRRETEARLRRVERMEAIGQFTGGIAHDFGNLLTVVLGSLELIVRQPDDAKRVERLARNAAAASRRGTELIDKLLNFSQPQATSLGAVNLNQVLEEAMPLLRRCAGQVAVKLCLEPELPAVKIDPDQFQIFMLNLAGRARDAAPAGGTLRIATRVATIAPGDPTRAAPPGSYVVVDVADGADDTTLGGPVPVRAPWLGPQDTGEGAGPVYGFMQQAGGHCESQAGPDGSLRLCLYFPRILDAVQPAAAEDQMPFRRARGGEVVLIVEDDELVREMAGESLVALGYGVMTASDARIALDLLRYPTRIDILFSDVVMPGGMNGAQLAVEARKLRPTLKVLLTSGYTGMPPGERELPSDIPLLCKPYLHEDLAARLQSVLAS